MEAVERYSGEHCDYAVELETYNAIVKMGAAIDPTQIIVPEIQKYRPDLPLEWVKGFDLIQEEPTYAPLNCVVCPYSPRQGAALYYTSTNGLASGNFLVEALCQALCEIIERDALAIYAAAIALKPAIYEVLSNLGRVSKNSTKVDVNHRYPLIDHQGLPLRAARLVGKMKLAGLEVYLRNITSTMGIPTIDCTIVKRQPVGEYEIHAGYGTHPDARVALMRAITEAAQSRVGWIQGGREDLPEVAMHVQKVTSPEIIEGFGSGPKQSFHSIPSTETHFVDEDVKHLLTSLRKSGLEQVVAFDLTRPELNIPVVRIVVPRAESWSAFRLHTGRGVFGPRIAQMLKED
jgi:ribosomal protein S12 methylthiotransferase accessory factor